MGSKFCGGASDTRDTTDKGKLAGHKDPCCSATSVAGKHGAFLASKGSVGGGPTPSNFADKVSEIRFTIGRYFQIRRGVSDIQHGLGRGARIAMISRTVPSEIRQVLDVTSEIWN